MTTVVIVVACWLLFGALGGWLAKSKGHDPTGYLILGMVLGLLGLAITMLVLLYRQPPTQTRPAAGWYPSPTPGVVQWWTGWEWSRHVKPVGLQESQQ
jgi:Protein of unknown function (DUF2510)